MTHVQTAQIRFGQKHEVAGGPWGGVPNPDTDSEQQYSWPQRYVSRGVWDAVHPTADAVDHRVWGCMAAVVMDRLLRL